ncbi:MAG: FAD:protein FMN transferase [Desulfobacterales bacterium]
MKILRRSKILKLAAAAAAAAVFTAAGFFLLTGKNQDRRPAETISPQDSQENKPAEVSELSSGWWESRQNIYYGIPARIVFHLPEGDRGSAEKIAENAWAEFARIGKIFDPSDQDSETSRLNSADKTKQVAVSDDMFEVLKLCRKLWEASDGAFDPTTTALKKLWQDAADTQEIPSQREIKSVLSKTGFKHVGLVREQKAVVCDKKGIEFDFGGIAKGFAVEKTAGLLRDSGATDCLVQLGGEIAAFGANQGGEPWRIGIQHPTDMQDIWGRITTKSAVRVSTSGNYRQPLKIQGHDFYHIFSPETGKPVSSRVLGVTTADPDGSTSSALLDGAATAITVAGPEKGLDLAEKLGIEGLILTRQDGGEITETATSGMSEYYERKNGRDP